MGKRKVKDSEWRPKHLSHSSVSSYERCPASYKRKYIEGIDEPPNAPMLFGRAMAKSLEVAHNGGDALVAFCEEYAKACDVIDKFGSYMFIRPELGLTALMEYLKNMTHGVPEKYFSVYLPELYGVPVPIVGYMDLMAPVEILEFKTSAGGWTQERADNSHQNHLYGYAFDQLNGYYPDWVRFVIMGTRIQQIDEYIAIPTSEGLDRFGRSAQALWRSLEEDDFPMTCGSCAVCKEDKKRIKLLKSSSL